MLRRYLVLERVEGVPAAVYLCDNNMHRLGDLVQKVAEAWGHLCVCGVMHQDLRWRNIMYNEKLDRVCTSALQSRHVYSL